MRLPWALLAALLVALAFAKDKPRLTADEVLQRNIEALGGEEAIRRAHTYVKTFQLTDGNGGVQELVVYRKAPNKFLDVFKGQYEFRQAFNGTVGWN